MDGPLGELGVSSPVLAAPMSGGPTTPALVVGAARAGSLGFLAGGYKSVMDLADQIRQVRAQVPVFGVNLFAPNPLPVDPGEYRAYADRIKADGDRYGLDLSTLGIREDDDDWATKVDLLTDTPVPIVSFTFGIPDRDVIRRIRRTGSVLVQTVTSLQEARLAVAAGVDMLALQSREAGGHFATLTPDDPAQWPTSSRADLIARIRADTDLPIIAAGGINTSRAVGEVLQTGVCATMVGTYLLRVEESGASAAYKAALAERIDQPTGVTRAFSGRPARGIVNQFMVDHEPEAPLGYPAVHHLTTPMRRAATAAGDADRINIWAGTGHAIMAEGSVVDAIATLEAEL